MIIWLPDPVANETSLVNAGYLKKSYVYSEVYGTPTKKLHIKARIINTDEDKVSVSVKLKRKRNVKS